MRSSIGIPALQVLPKLGETYWIKTEFKSIPKPKNPNEFNYKQYLSYYNVYFKAYVKSSASYVSCHEESPWFTRLLNYARHNVQFIFQKFLQDKNAYLIAQALILGGKNSLDEDVKSNFAHTGTLHVLAVSRSSCWDYLPYCTIHCWSNNFKKE